MGKKSNVSHGSVASVDAKRDIRITDTKNFSMGRYSFKSNNFKKRCQLKIKKLIVFD
jgi:hypothetical protein